MVYTPLSLLLQMMNDYELLGLMDTFKELQRHEIQGVPNTLEEFLRGLQPINNRDNKDGTVHT